MFHEFFLNQLHPFTHSPDLKPKFGIDHFKLIFTYTASIRSMGYIDKGSGEFIPCRFFGMALCNSRMFFPYATLDQKQGSWLAGIRGAFEYFNGAFQHRSKDLVKSVQSNN